MYARSCACQTFSRDKEIDCNFPLTFREKIAKTDIPCALENDCH